MRPVSAEFPINQAFASMRTAGVVGNINASPDTVEYWVGRYGNYQPDGHAGCDFACPEGTPVYAMADGTVLWADWGTKLPGDDSWGHNGYFRRWALYKGFPGIVTVIQHNGWIGVYAHLSDAPLNPGDTVVEGQRIATSGSTGGVDPHLHVEALIDLNYPTGNGLIYGRTNPEPFFGAQGIAAMGGPVTPIAQEEPLVPNESDKVFWPIQGNEKVSLNELLNSIDRKSTAALAAITGLLGTKFADPSQPGKTYALADFIVWGATNAKLAAGSAGVAVENTTPEALAKAVAEGAAAVDAAAIADRLQVSVRK